jgi:hypothetical protein
VLDANFPHALRTAITPAAASAQRADARAHAPLQGGATYPTPPLPLQPWSALLVALLFLAERVLAARTRWTA